MDCMQFQKTNQEIGKNSQMGKQRKFGHTNDIVARLDRNKIPVFFCLLTSFGDIYKRIFKIDL